MITKTLFKLPAVCSGKGIATMLIIFLFCRTLVFSQAVLPGNGINVTNVGLDYQINLGSISSASNITQATNLTFANTTTPSLTINKDGTTNPYLQIINNGKIGIGMTPPAGNVNSISNVLLSINGHLFMPGTGTRILGGSNFGGGTTEIILSNGLGAFDFNHLANAPNPLSRFSHPLQVTGKITSVSPANTNYYIWFEPSDNTIRGNNQSTFNSIQVYHPTSANMSLNSRSGINFSTGIAGANGDFVWNYGTTPIELMRLKQSGISGINGILGISGILGVGTNNPNSCAILDLTSTNRGLLIPRMNNTQRGTIPTPVEGLLIYNTENRLFEYRDHNNNWVPLDGGGGLPTLQQYVFKYGTGSDANRIFIHDQQDDEANPKMLFVPSLNGAFRVGQATSTQWNFANMGTGSFATGNNTMASGNYSTAVGQNNSSIGIASFTTGVNTIAEGDKSTALGEGTIALSTHETVIGRFNVAAGDGTTWNATDPLFTIGNGDNDLNRHNAVTVLKNGNVGVGTPTPNTPLEVEGKTKTTYLQVTNHPISGPPPPPIGTGYVLAAHEDALNSPTSDGTAEWKDLADLGGIKWTARKLGLLGNDLTDNYDAFVAAINRTDIHTIWFESDLGSIFRLAGNASGGNGIINCNGKVLKFENGNMLRAFQENGTTTLTNVIIDASNESHIFDLSIDFTGSQGRVSTTRGWFSAKWYGALGNDENLQGQDYPLSGDPRSTSANDQPAIQKAIDVCIITYQTRLIIPSGAYKLESPLVLRPHNANEFVTLHISGESIMWGSPGTRLYPTFNDAFVIGIQLGKGCKITNLTIEGKFEPPPYGLHPEYPPSEDIVHNITRGFMDRVFDVVLPDDDPQYSNIGFGDQTILPHPYLTKKARDRRFSPYAAIVIDPFTNDDIPEGQKDRNFPDDVVGYPGMESYYGAIPSRGEAGSTAIEIEDVSINKFVVGIACSPNGVTLNDELIKISRAKIGNCKLSISGSQAQEKANVVDGLGVWGNTHTVFATGKYGAGSWDASHPSFILIPAVEDGMPVFNEDKTVKYYRYAAYGTQAGNWHVSNVNVAIAVQLIDNQQSEWYPSHFDNIYTEAIGQVGIITAKSSHSITNGTEVSNCTFNFEPYFSAGYRKLAETDGGVTFKNCTFRYYDGYMSYHLTADNNYLHQAWKEHRMMVFNCKETLFEDCKFSGVPIQDKEMSDGEGYKSANTYKNCTAAKYSFGQKIDRHVAKLTNDNPYSPSLDDDVEHLLFYNDFKGQSFGEQKYYGDVLETYQFESKEVFVPFFGYRTPTEENQDTRPRYEIELTEGSVTTFAGNTDLTGTTQSDNTKCFTQITVENTDVYYVGAVVVFSDYATPGIECHAIGYGLVTAIDEGEKRISIAYISPSVKSTSYWTALHGIDPGLDPSNLKAGYFVACLYPAEQCGSFMGDIKNVGNGVAEINKVAPDWGVKPEEYVGHLIKCPYNGSMGGWTKIVNFIPDATNGDKFNVLGNFGSGFAEGTARYFNNGATKNIETTAGNRSITNNVRKIIFYRGEKIIEKDKSDLATEYLCVQTGYNSLSHNGYNLPSWEHRKACVIAINMPECEDNVLPVEIANRAWNLQGNKIIAAATKKGIDSSDAAAEADTTQFLGTTNNVSLRIRTANKERLTIDKAGAVMIGGVDVSTISNHKDPKQNYLFAVKGNAIFERAVVKLSTSWPDFVFDDKYALLPLAQLELYIKENKHLPGLPSAEEVKEKGIDLGNNQAALLNKLEEVTLYIIEQNKKSEEQNKKIDALEKQNVQLLEVQKQIDELKKAIQNKSQENH